MSATSHIQDAYKIALSNLRARYTARGIVAGSTHFSDIWVRDSMYASFGALSVGDYEIVKINLETLLKYKSDTYQIPLRVGEKHFMKKFLFGISSKTPQARFIDDKNVSVVVDSNSLFMIGMERYLEYTQDKQFARTHYDDLRKILDWNFTQDKDQDLLIEEGYYAGWADSIRKKGCVLYTNVLHYSAVNAMATISSLLGEKEFTHHYEQLSERVLEKINDTFWNNGFYIDWVNGSKKQDILSTDGNILSILLGVANMDQAHAIQDSIATFGIDHDFSVETNYPRYKKRHIFPFFHLVNMSDYHNGVKWLWLGCIDSVSKYIIGRKKEAMATIDKIAQKIIEYNGVYEVYDKGAPLKRLCYKSEQGFAWSSGLYVWACKELGLVN